ncbi:putative D-inositol-3-phosphate glycosyltransferase [Hollandina sp. SP2]
MNILHIVAGELTGGAARGAYWLHCGLRKLGIDSNIFTNSKITFDDNTVITISKSKTSKLMNILRTQVDQFFVLFYRKKQKALFSPGLIGFNFTKTKEYKEADIIHLHWICGGFINIRHLKNIHKPIIWTLRDMWPMTGGCHYSMDCNRYEIGCGNCTQLNSNHIFDLSKIIINRKIKYLSKMINIVGISNTLSDSAKNSTVFRNYNIQTIPNNINTDEFFPVDKDMARQFLGIKTNKRIILTGAVHIQANYKGFDKYLETLYFLDKSKYFLCFFGYLNTVILKTIEFEHRSFGFVYDSISLRLLYNCADVFVVPSVMEAFGKTLVESMSCGTPVVCFDASGPKDIVSHKIDGYKAKPFESEDMARGIEWIINESDYSELCNNARKKAIQEFDSTVIAKKYRDLYKVSLMDYQYSIGLQTKDS